MRIFEKISKNIEISNFTEKDVGQRGTLRVLRAETWLTVYHTISITRRAGVFPMKSRTKTIAKRARVEPRTQVHVTMEKLFWMATSGEPSTWFPLE